MTDDERREQQDLYRTGPTIHLPESKDRDPERRAMVKQFQASLDQLKRDHNYLAFEERNAEITLKHRHLYAQQTISQLTEKEAIGVFAYPMSRPAAEAKQRAAKREIARLNEANSHNAAMLRHCEDVLAKRDERIEREGLQGADVQPEDDDIPF